MSGPAPFGTRRVDGTLVPEPAEQGVVRELVQAFIASGGRIQATAVALSSKGYTTRRGTAWSGTGVGRVIRNPALSELVHDDLWRRCEPLLEDRRARRPAHPFGSVVHCKCGGRMRPRGQGSTGKYVCADCRAKITQETLEKLFENSLSSVEIEAAEIVAGLKGASRAAEINRALGGRAVPLSEIWPELDLPGRRQLVDLLIDQLVVGHDGISVVFAENKDSEPKSAPPPVNSFTTHHGPEATSVGATSSNRRRSLDDLPGLLSVGEVAEALRISQSKVYELIAARQLPAYKPGGRLRIPSKLVREFLRDSRLARNSVR